MSGRHRAKDKFTAEDDERLKDIIGDTEEINWREVAEKMGNKNVRQCKDRWINYLSPTVNRTKFSLQEDIMLLEKYKNFGPKWVFISKFFENRTDVSIKARFLILKRRGYTVEYLKRLLDRRLHQTTRTKKAKAKEEPSPPAQTAILSDLDLFSQITMDAYEKENTDIISLFDGKENSNFYFV